MTTLFYKAVILHGEITLRAYRVKGVSGKAQKGNQLSLDCLFVLKTVTQQSSKKF